MVVQVSDSARPVLEFRDFSLGFEGAGGRVHNLLDRLSFRVEPDSILGVVGESGCGKSLTALSAMRLLPGGTVHQGGDIVFDGGPKSAARPLDG